MKKFLVIFLVLYSCKEKDPVYFDFSGYQKDFIFYKLGDTIHFINKSNEVFQYVVKKYDVGYFQRNLFPKRNNVYLQCANIEFNNVANDQYAGRINAGLNMVFMFYGNIKFSDNNIEFAYDEFKNNKLFYDSIRIQDIVYYSVYMIYEKTSDNSIAQKIYLNRKFGFIQFNDSVLNETYTRF